MTPRPRSGSADLWGVTAPALESQLGGVSAPAGSAPAAGHIPFTPKTKKVLEGSLRQTALLGHEEIGTEHLLLALLDDPASTGAHILTDLVTLSVGEMREHLRRELAHRPTPGPTHRIPIRLNADEYTCAHAAGQHLETSGPRPHHRRPRTTRITGSVGGKEQLHRHEEPHHHCRHRHERAHQQQGEVHTRIGRGDA
ncbi:Clp protease N-terminal domain-containing protein, partial [Rhodococcus sp. ACS1]|uniref:Clp protease N-terminal domain-containing protein n=1 Tax=Rhodococcus sp. ACS1 TaxID=2028570 RepID=UPI00211BC5BE